jgi:hypothetical protein
MLKTVALLAVFLGAPTLDPISGTWRITGDIMGNPIDQVCTFQQNDSTLSGSCTTGDGGSTDITGEVEDGKVTFRHSAEYEGQTLTIMYSGTLGSPRKIEGTVTVQPFNVRGVFNATPTPEEP